MSASQRGYRRMGLVVVAAAAALVAGLPGAAIADPEVADPIAAEPVSTPSLPDAISALVGDAAADPVALRAARTIAAVKPSDVSAASELLELGRVDAVAPGDLFGAYQAAVSALRTLGINPFLYPTAAPFCNSASTPFGLSPAMAGTVPGPWPGVSVLGQDLNAVKPGETLFAFVPQGIEPGGPVDGMDVAWFNLSTFKGGFVPMGSLSEVAARAVPANLPVEIRPVVESAVTNFMTSAVPLGGIRAVPVETGKGTVLAAVFGTVQNGEKSCFFFPTAGITTVK